MKKGRNRARYAAVSQAVGNSLGRGNSMSGQKAWSWFSVLLA